MTLTRKTSMSRRLTMLAAGAIIVLCGLSAACSSPQAKEARYLRRGEAYLAKKDYARAMLEFKNAAGAMPKDAEPYYQMGVTFMAQGIVANAFASLRKAAALNPKHQGAQLKLAELLASGGRQATLQQAAGKLEGLVSTLPDNAEASDALAITEWKLGQTGDAVSRLENTLQKFPARLQTSVKLAQLKLRQKDMAGAVEVLKQAVASAPQSSAAELALGMLYMVANQPGPAETELRKAVQLDPKSGPALMGLASIQAGENRLAAAEENYRQAAALPGSQFKPVHALFLYKEGKRDAALAEFEKLAKEDPADRAARNRLFAAYVAMGKNPAAQSLVAAALKENPKDTDALFERAGISLRAGNAGEAEKDLREVLHFKPDLAQGHLAMAEIDKANNQPMAERQELTEALRLNPALLEARLRLARSFTQAKEPKSALDLLNRTPLRQKAVVAVVTERNWALLGVGDTKELRSVLDRALSIHRFPELLIQDAALRLEQGDYMGARAAAEEAFKNNPDDVRGPRILADTYLAQKQPERAEARLKELAAEHPRSAPLANLLGIWYQNAKNLPAARKAFEAALTADPKFVDAALALARIDYQEKHFDAARQRLLEVVAADPKNIPGQLMLASMAGDAGNQEEAVTRYRAVLSLDSSNVTALNELAYTLAASQPDEAMKYGQQAAELAPNNAAVEDTLGWVYYKKAIYGTAVTHLETAVAKQPTPRRQFHLAMCYLKAGQRELGEKTLQLALRQDPNLPVSEKGW